ncbi:MAG: indole-3-glycerol phosphate synthase TrpC [Dehalococcoidia bacterium]
MAKTRTILDRIVEAKRKDLAEARRGASLAELERRIASQPAPRSLSAVLRGERIDLIAEVKKASPSRGLLVAHFDPAALARIYTENGASAISILTETPHFQGSLDHLEAVREALGPSCPPLLRKDFIFDPYQVHEARAWGADALLLIAAILTQVQIKQLIAEAKGLGMECLVEVHSRSEVQAALGGGAEIVGINNRDLTTFEVDLETTRRLRPAIPGHITVVAESGIFTRDQVATLAGWGVDAVLVGEGLLKAPDVGAKVRELAGLTQRVM